MKKYSLNEIYDMDQRLLNLAAYEVTKGLIFIPRKIEDLANLQKKTAEKFNEFKMMIQRGSCTLDFIQDTVLAKNGPVPRDNEDDDEDRFIERLLNEAHQDPQGEVSSEDVRKAATEYFQLMDDLLKMIQDGKNIPLIPTGDETDGNKITDFKQLGEEKEKNDDKKDEEDGTESAGNIA